MNFLGHTSVNCFVAGASGAILHHYSLLTIGEALLYTAGFVFSTFMLGPDLDLYYSKVNKNWGVLRFIWWPYAKVSKHRGLSHAPFISSFIRIFYVLIALIFVIGGLGLWSYLEFTGDNIGWPQIHSLQELWPFVGTFFKQYQMEITAAVMGVIISDIFHLTVDHLSSFKKKMFG